MGRYDFANPIKLKRTIVYTEAELDAPKNLLAAAIIKDARLIKAIKVKTKELEPSCGPFVWADGPFT